MIPFACVRPSEQGSEQGRKSRQSKGYLNIVFKRASVAFLFLLLALQPLHATPWSGAVLDATGKPVAAAKVTLQSSSDSRQYSVETSPTGEFRFENLSPGSYSVTVAISKSVWTSVSPVAIASTTFTANLQLSGHDQTLAFLPIGTGAATKGSGGENLSSGEVSSLPLNERDFSKLLLLAAGTMTDTNGAANFTQQFAVTASAAWPPSSRWTASIPPTRNSAARHFRISTSMRFRKCSPAPA